MVDEVPGEEFGGGLFTIDVVIGVDIDPLEGLGPVAAVGVDGQQDLADEAVAQREKRLDVVPLRQVVDDALAWLSQVPADEPVFLWVHLYDAHFPYHLKGDYAATLAAVVSARAFFTAVRTAER